MSRRRRLALSAVALIVIVGPALAVDEVLWRGAHSAALASAISDAILDPGSIFAARSPGARGAGLLLQTKRDRVAPAAYGPPGGPEGPAERVLAAIRERPPETDLFAPPAPPPLVQTLPEFAGGPPPASAAYPAPPFLPFPPGAGFLPLANVPPGGGTPPGGPPPGDTPGGPLSPVPEPAAWLLMNMAVFGVGAALRWKRSRRSEATGFNA